MTGDVQVASLACIPLLYAIWVTVKFRKSTSLHSNASETNVPTYVSSHPKATGVAYSYAVCTCTHVPVCMYVCMYVCMSQACTLDDQLLHHDNHNSGTRYARGHELLEVLLHCTNVLIMYNMYKGERSVQFWQWLSSITT